MTALRAEAPARPAGWRRPLRRLHDRLGASDPAFSRLRMASRAMLSLALCVVLLLGVHQVHPLPFAVFGLAFVISFNGTLAVRDKGWRAQAQTRAIAWVAAGVAVAAASLLAAWPIAADAAFLAVIFAAVYARALGPRWTAVGMISFMAFFMGDYFKPPVADLPWIAGGAALAFIVTQIVTNVILPDDPARDFRRALVSLDQRLQVMLRQLLEHPVDRPKMQAELSRLRDVVMMAEGFIPQGDDGSLAARGPASELAIALFDVQLIAERLARASYVAAPPPALVRAAMRGATLPEQAEDVATRMLLRLRRARAVLDRALAATPSPFAAAPAPAAAKAAAKAGSLLARFKAPIQVTLACAVAMAAGLVVSPSRWYWAVITAFIVFNNTKSRADTAFRALQRSLGTFAGLIGGTILATLLSGQPVIAAALMPVCFFLAFYYLQVSYSVMIFFITLALALLYGLTGSFAPAVLLLRLEETVIGAVSGTIMAFLVFPSRTATGVGAALDTFLNALGDVASAAKGRATGAAEPLHLMARSRLLDRSYTDLAAAVRPIGGPWATVTRFGEVRERLLLLSAIVHWARVLARSLPSGASFDPAERTRIAEAADHLSRNVVTARGLETSFFERADGAEVTALQPRPPVAIRDEADPRLALEMMISLLDRATPIESGRAA